MKIMYDLLSWGIAKYEKLHGSIPSPEELSDKLNDDPDQ